MSTLQETKSLVAKLMAEENLHVQHGNYETAMFDLENRTLFLPIYKWMNGPVYDLMCSHEVGHARYTPRSGWHETEHEKGHGFKSFLNVVEDARIEKKIKRKFPGARKQMIEGYSTLLREDFFGVKGVDLNELPLIDRINMYTKAGGNLGVEFTEEEYEYVEMVERTETFQDVLDVTNKLWEYANENVSETDRHKEFSLSGSFEQDDDDEEQSESSPGDVEEEDWELGEGDEEESDGDSSGKDFKDSDEINSDKKDEEENGNEVSSNPKGGFGSPDSEFKPSSYTDNEWQKHQDDLVQSDDINRLKYLYLDAPKADLKTIVVDYKNVLVDIEEKTSNRDLGCWGDSDSDSGETLNSLWQKFRTKNTKVINYLAKEFEMKKAAHQHSRNLTAKTGILDSGNLFKYRYSEDIFKKMCIVPDGKNHGLLLFIDWSGSMFSNIQETAEQCLVLAAFCEKVKISFEVYLFTDTYRKNYEDCNGHSDQSCILNRGINVHGIGHFRLLNILSSRMNKRNFQKGAKYFLGLAESIVQFHGMHTQQSLSTPSYYSLGGTPLDDAILTSLTLVPEFKKHSGAEIVNVVYLTDGASRDCSNYYNENFKYDWYSASASNGRRRYGKRVFLKLANGKIADLENGGTSGALKALKMATDVNIIGFYIAKNTWYKKHGQYEVETSKREQRRSEFRKGSTVTFIDGYDERYILNIDKIKKMKDSDLEDLNETSTKGEIKKAFTKMVESRLTNRVILNRMIDLIS